jgi:hypothetical protein
MTEPTTTWQESPTPDEEALLAKLGEAVAEMQRGTTKKFAAKGRGLHRKGRGLLKARFEVLPSAPAWTRHGVFATTTTYEATLRLSNASALVQPDSAPDIRGVAIKLHGVNGPGALGSTTTSQDFLCINQDAFGIKDGRQFVEIACAAARGPAELIGHLIKTFGFFGALSNLKRLVATLSKPFSGFLDERFSTTVPFACGPYAVRLRIVPTSPAPPSTTDADVKRRIAAGEHTFTVQLQGFVSETATPIEDASVNWDEAQAPWVDVARLTVLRQELVDAEQVAGEALRFDPWNALVEHRPLGHIMRVRKVAYYMSQQGRA